MWFKSTTDRNVFFSTVALIALFVIGAFTALCFRVSGDLAVCKSYYPEMNRFECYFSTKTVRVPGGKP